VIRGTAFSLGAVGLTGVITWESAQSLAVSGLAMVAGWFIHKYVMNLEKKLDRIDKLEDTVLELRTQYDSDKEHFLGLLERRRTPRPFTPESPVRSEHGD
jgi:hypothetical protein